MATSSEGTESGDGTQSAPFSVKQQRARAVNVTFNHLSVEIKKAKILHDVSGVAKAGTMLAVMGPSGAGKSTLLNTISGRVPATSGTLTLNNEPMNKAMRRRICYVLQNDLFFPDLKLLETLTYAAMLRLPDKMTDKHKMRRVHEIIDVLDLRKCVNTPMGGMNTPGLSGGEKKRASIAVELLTNPSLMLLDEPTSGLDAATAKSLVSTLGRYASESGKTVVATIHQPSSSVFYMFDNILLIANGKLVYFGKGTKIMDFYASVGLRCSLHYNPADFILEQLKAGPEVEESLIAACKDMRYGSDWREELRGGETLQGGEGARKGGSADEAALKQLEDLRTEAEEDIEIKGFDNPTFTADPEDNIGQSSKGYTGNISGDIEDVVEEAMDNYYKDGDKWPTSWSTQFSWLTRRALRVARARILSVLNIMKNVVIAIMVGLLYFQIPRTEERANDRMGVVYFSCIYYSMNPVVDAITSFPFEKGLIDRERSAGTYRLSAYYLAKTVSELPLVCAMPLVYLVVVYWMAGLYYSAWHFVCFCLVILLSTTAAQGVGIFLGVCFPKVPPALTSAILFLLFSLLTGGFLTQNIPYWIEWAKYLSFINYTFNALLQIEFNYGPPLICASLNTTAFVECRQPAYNGSQLYVTGAAFLERQDMTIAVWWGVTALAVYFILFRTAAYIVLRTIRSPT